MSLELMNKISDNYLMAVAVHKSLADVFWFGYMPGYALMQEFYHLDESLTQRKIKRYITSTYHIFTSDKLPKTANITEPLLVGKNRKALKMEDSWRLIKESFKIWQEWEEGSLQLYQQIAKDIFANGEISTFNFVSEIIKDVKKEVVFVNDKIIELNSMDWDMSQIVAEQTNYLERFEKLIRELFGKSKKYHRHNSALDADARTSLLNKYPD